MQRVADNTYRLGTKGHNYYVVEEGGQATIVDAGCSREMGRMVAGLESIGLSLDAVAGIVVTHSHADHFGFAKEATEQGIPVSVHTDEETRARGTYAGKYAVEPTELPWYKLSAIKTFFPMIFRGVMSHHFVDDITTFGDGDTLELPGSPVIIHTPGHTEGHTMFHLPDRGLLFTGDGLITMDLLGPGRGPQMIDRRFNNDHDAALSSLDKLSELEADLLLPGHGDPWPGSPHRAVELARN